MKGKKQAMKVVHVTLTRHIPLQEKTCPQCGKGFMGIKTQKYCSKACSNLAAYWRHPEAYRQARIKSYQKQKEGQATRKRGRPKKPLFLSDRVKEEGREPLR